MEFLTIGLWQLLLLLAVAFIIVLLPIKAILSVAGNQFPVSTKVIWIVLIVILPIIGSLVYFEVGKSTRANQ